ncbi:MAG: hypothetical protein RL670_1024, partial [Actinomycetota bacterium]
MRFLITSLLFVASLLSLLLGVAERTVWAPVTDHRMAITLTQNAPYVIIPTKTLASYPGVPTVTASGTPKVFASVGRQEDIAAWVGSGQHINIELNDDKKSLVENSIPGTGVLGDPSGSDLWRDERHEADSLSIPVETTQNGALLLASNGAAHAPTKISVDWNLPVDNGPSNMALIIGGILLIAALILNWLTYRHIRITRGPRRRTPKAPRGPQLRRLNVERTAPSRGRRVSGRHKLAAPTGLLVLGLLTGCSANASVPVASPSKSTNANSAPVSLLSSQLGRILNEVALQAAAGDKTKDTKQMQGRFNGPALEIRSAHYLLQQR